MRHFQDLQQFKRIGISFLLCVTFALSLGADPKAMLVNRDDVVECILDTRKTEETGVFIWLFSNELETGYEDILGGLKGVDYKLEDGTLSRYVRGSENPWQAVANLKQKKYGPWQIYHLPKSLFLKPNGKLKWRLVLFPHHKKPLFLPKTGVAELILDHSLKSPAVQTGQMAVECFLNVPENHLGTAWLGFKNHESLNWPKNFVFEQPFEARPEHFNGPDHQTLWWPEMPASANIIIRQDAVLGKKIKMEHKSVLFAPLDQNTELKPEILSARAKASLASGRRCYFYARTREDIPAKATGVVLLMSKNLKESIIEWKAIRESYSGPLWLEIDQSYWSLPEADRDLVNRASLMFRIRFMLPVDQPVEELNHKRTRFIIWHKLHVDQMLSGSKSFNKYMPIPSDVKIKKRWRKRQYAYRYYLKELYRDMQRTFAEALKG